MDDFHEKQKSFNAYLHEKQKCYIRIMPFV